MKNSVVIKGNKYGIIVILDDSMPYEDLKNDIVYKFSSSKSFLGKSSIAVTFEGRKLSNDEEKEIISIIEDNTDLTIVCIMDSDKVKEAIYKKAVEDVTKVTNKDSVEVETYYDSDDNANAQFYTGTLRSGQQVSCEGSVVIIGDVNPGATVTSGGNIVILGSLRGTAIAGCNGDTSTFVVALEMDPLQIRIGDVIASSNDNSFMSTMNIREKRKAQQVKIAYADNDNIYIDLLNKETINNIIN